MKSSNDISKDVLVKYFRVLVRPTDVFSDLSSKSVNLVETFIIIILSSVLLVSGIFLVGDALYTTFHNYAYSYLLEILTSGQLFGYYLAFDSYVLVYITDIIFCLKAWIFLSLLLFLFLRLFKQQISVKRAAQVIAWSIFPFTIVMFIASIISVLFKYLLPGIYHYIYFGILGIIFIVIMPIYIYGFLDKLKNVSAFNALRSYYLALFVVFLIFTINHAEKILNMLW